MEIVMSRVKHLILIITKVVYLVLVCAATMVMMSMQDYTESDAITIAKNFDADSVKAETKGGASVTWEIVDGELVFDVSQSGKSYDDIRVFLTYKNIGYDSTFIRSLIGEDAGKHEAFISEMENGPWLAHINYCLKGDSFLTTNKGAYTFVDAANGEYEHGISSSGANTSERSDDFTVAKNDGTVTVALIFGSEDIGALDSGKYTLKCDLKLTHPEGKVLDATLLEQAGIILRFATKSVKAAGWEIFNITSWLTFYGALILLGWFIYLWRDLRTMVKIFFALLEGDGTRVIIRTYINGVFAEEHEEYANGSNIFIALILTILCYVVFLVTIPIRILINLIRDIIYLVKEDDDIEAFSFLGNILGSVGIYALIVGIVGLVSQSYVIGVIAGGVGLAMCIAAHFLCKRREEEYG